MPPLIVRLGLVGSVTAKTLIVGLGNPLLGDDGVGWKIAEQVEYALPSLGAVAGPIEVDYLAVGGLDLMERLIGYDRVILIDAIVTGNHPRGTVFFFQLGDMPNRAEGHLSNAHDTTLQNAIEVGISMGAKLPEKVLIIAVESEYVYEFSEQLTPATAQAVPLAVRAILALLEDASSSLVDLPGVERPNFANRGTGFGSSPKEGTL